MRFVAICSHEVFVPTGSVLSTSADPVSSTLTSMID